ncbi:MAG: cysteine desulfurase DndA [Ignavibacteriales bacterium]
MRDLPLYLDYNATTPVHPEVLDAMVDTYRDNFGNAASRTHVYGHRASQAVDKARLQVAALLGVDKDEIIFTSGATESDNLAILGLARWGAENNRRHIVSTSIEHKAVLEPLEHLSKSGFEVELVSPDHTGRVGVENILERVRTDTLLVSVMHANNETGVIQPVLEIGEALASTGTYFHIDAAQTFGKLVSELRGIRYDLLSISAHKVYGPQGIGALILRRRRYRRPPVQPITFGGGQEGGLRSGTLPVALIVGMGKAAEVAERDHREWYRECLMNKKSILRQVEGLHYTVNGSLEFGVPHCLNISFPGVDSEALMLCVRDELAISNGSACTSHDYRPSHVLLSMGLAPEIVRGAIRLSWGYGSGQIDLSPLIQAVKRLI